MELIFGVEQVFGEVLRSIGAWFLLWLVLLFIKVLVLLAFGV